MSNVHNVHMDIHVQHYDTLSSCETTINDYVSLHHDLNIMSLTS